MTPGGRRARVLLGTVALGVLGAGCGVPVDARPTALARSGVPFGLLEQSVPSTTPTSTPSQVGVPVSVYFLGPSGHVAPVVRDVAMSPPDLFAILGTLVLGPTDAEAAAGLQSAVPAQTTVLGATIAGGVAIVNLAGTFDQLVGAPQIQAVAQIVFTASSLPGVTGVAFELAGTPVEVPVASGAQVPVASTGQFASLAPLPPSVSPTPAAPGA